MNLPTILIMNFNEEDAIMLELFSKMQKVIVRKAECGEYFETIASLIGLENKNGKKSDYDFSETLVLFANFSDDLLSLYLGAMSRNVIPNASLKAILTKNNMHWSAAKLIEELSAERKAIESQKNGKQM